MGQRVVQRAVRLLAGAGRARARVGSTTAPPILLVGQTFDAPTPFAGSLEARRLFPNARLIEVRGGTEHAVTPNGNACVDDQIAAYLADGTLTARRHEPGRQRVRRPPAPGSQRTGQQHASGRRRVRQVRPRA